MDAKTKQKRVLLLNASHNDERLLKALKNMGCYVITTGNRPNLPGHRLADEYVYGDYTDQEAMYQLALEKHVDAVCPCCNDFGVITAAYISEKMGFRGQDDYETTLTIHNKARFKAFALQLGEINTPMATAFSQLEEALCWAEQGQYTLPLIVKPVDLSAGNGIRRADTKEELVSCIQTAFDRSRIKEIVIEPFIEGTQHGFCTYLIHQKVVAVCSNNEHSFINPYRVEVDTFPAQQVELVQGDLIRQIERMAKALSLTDGIFHLQYILHDGKAYILECMRRVLGNLYSIPAEGLGEGFDWDYWEVRAKCGFDLDDFPTTVSQKGFWAYRALIARQNGKFQGIHIPPEMQKQIYAKRMLQNIGDRITNYLSEPMGFLFFRFDTYQEMMQTMIERYDDIRVLVEEEKNEFEHKEDETTSIQMN